MATWEVDTGTSDLSPSWTFTAIADLPLNSTLSSSSDTRSDTITQGAVTGYGFITTSGSPNNDTWPALSGLNAILFVMDISSGNMNLRGRCNFHRLNSSGVSQESTGFTGYQTLDSGFKNYGNSSYTWGSASCSDRLAVEFEVENTDTMMDYTFSFFINDGTGGSGCTWSAMTENSGSCTGGSTFTPKCIIF